MRASVTVPGTGTSTISEAFNNQYNSALAQQIADALAAASNAHTLNITTASGGVSPPAPSLPGTNELIILSGGDYTIPAATGGISDYVVVLDTASPVTIHGGPNASIWGGLGPTTLSDPALITIAESAGAVPVTITGTGDLVAGNNANDTIIGLGNNATIQSGTGNNVLSVGGANNFILAGTGTNTVLAGGLNDTIDAQAGTAVATLSGSAGLFLGGLGGFSLLDSVPATRPRAAPGSGTSP